MSPCAVWFFVPVRIGSWRRRYLGNTKQSPSLRYVLSEWWPLWIGRLETATLSSFSLRYSLVVKLLRACIYYVGCECDRLDGWYLVLKIQSCVIRRFCLRFSSVFVRLPCSFFCVFFFFLFWSRLWRMPQAIEPANTFEWRDPRACLRDEVTPFSSNSPINNSY